MSPNVIVLCFNIVNHFSVFFGGDEHCDVAKVAMIPMKI